MRLLSLFVLAATTVCVVRPAQAQFFYPFQARAATAEESFARGISDMVRAAGEANLLNSQAAINVEDARSKYLDNRLKGTETYFEMRRRNREYREAERGPRATTEQLFRLANEQVPDKLSVSELDPLTGGIEWPVLLRRDEFAAHRQVLDAAFAHWAEHQGNLPSETYVQIQQSGNEMLQLLRANIRNYQQMGIPPRDYTAARNFLQSLLHQSGLGA